MELNLSPVVSSVENIDEAIDSIPSALDCDWDDEVHDSFYRLADELKSISQSTKDLVNEFRSASNNLHDVNVNSLKNTLQALTANKLGEG